ncbi:MAG: hypothetical protein ACXVAF_13445, partial [Vulcanimicrobiaceae bacterium]
ILARDWRGGSGHTRLHNGKFFIPPHEFAAGADLYGVLPALMLPIAAGALYPSLKVLLAPESSALLMNASTITVTLNALLLNRVRLRAS